MGGYLADFCLQIQERNFTKFLQLWEEYCTSDTIEAEEFIQLLKMIKTSDFAKHFGQFVETALPLWETIQDPSASYEVLKLLIDLQTTNSPLLAEKTLAALQKKHGSHPQFNDRLRLIGLRQKDNFQGALANYDLLNHVAKGKFVYHTAGWGTGEILEVSLIREQLAIEFENVPGQKHLTFANAFKTLIPLPEDNFLARRFANPDLLETQARDNPVDVIKALLRDLGPKTAAEIKDELSVLVIPEKDWSKWWQLTRSKLKKDTMIQAPTALKDPFVLRTAEVSHEERILESLAEKTTSQGAIQLIYQFARDFAQGLKDPRVKTCFQDKLREILADPAISTSEQWQVHLFLEQQFAEDVQAKKVEALVQGLEEVESVVNAIDIIAFKKRALVQIATYRKDWQEIFLNLLKSVPQSILREYIVKELSSSEPGRSLLVAWLNQQIEQPSLYPDFLVWYFQFVKEKTDSADVPLQDKEGLSQLFEAFLILLSQIEGKPEYRDLAKKMYGMLTTKRYGLVRSILEGTSLPFVQEFLLLASKCHTLTDHDLKILRSLAEVVHPSLNLSRHQKKVEHLDGRIIWTTEEGYLKMQEKIRHLGTVEVVENAREIEAARALGDLRENSEYKFAVEKRHRLQGELKSLSDQFGRARIITAIDVSNDEIGIGSVATLKDPKGAQITYKILGPWDANPDENILSFQSKLAQAMLGFKEGDSFSFRDENYQVVSIQNIFEK